MNEVGRKMTANKVIWKAFAVNTADWEGAVLSLNLFDVICENKVLCLL
jgi:hypothetical protein